jgi:hypothetical protein
VPDRIVSTKVQTRRISYLSYLSPTLVLPKVAFDVIFIAKCPMLNFMLLYKIFPWKRMALLIVGAMYFLGYSFHNFNGKEIKQLDKIIA